MCLRGASAVNNILKEHEGTEVRAFVVWEPILPTDVARPSTRVLGRVPDARATQVWDPQQLIAKHLQQSAAPPQMQPECCDDEGVWWDLIAVYAPGPLWEERIPEATYINGTVVRAADEASDAIRVLAGGGRAGVPVPPGVFTPTLALRVAVPQHPPLSASCAYRRRSPAGRGTRPGAWWGRVGRRDSIR